MLASFALVALATVELAAGAKPDSVSSLPDVELVLTKATGKVHDFAEQASAMQHRVAQQQAAHSEAISANNTAIDKANKVLRTSIAGLETEVKTLQDDNVKMRQSLQTISAKVDAASAFLQDSIRITDDTDAEELKVLAPTTAKPTLDNFLAVAGANKLAFLQFPSLRSSDPEDLVNVISKSLADIATAEVEGATELRAHFLAKYEEGRKGQEALNVTNAELVEVQSQLYARQGKLLEARSHLEATGKQLRERLHGLRVFARKIDTVAAQAPGESAHRNATTPAKETVKHKPVASMLALKENMPASVAAAPVAPAAVAPAAAKKEQAKPQKPMLADKHRERRAASVQQKTATAPAAKDKKKPPASECPRPPSTCDPSDSFGECPAGKLCHTSGCVDCPKGSHICDESKVHGLPVCPNTHHCTPLGCAKGADPDLRSLEQCCGGEMAMSADKHKEWRAAGALRKPAPAKDKKKPGKAVLADKHKEPRAAGAHWKPPAASAAKPEERHGQSHNPSSAKAEQQHHGKHPEPPALIQSSTAGTTSEAPSFMHTWFSALR